MVFKMKFWSQIFFIILAGFLMGGGCPIEELMGFSPKKTDANNETSELIADEKNPDVPVNPDDVKQNPDETENGYNDDDEGNTKSTAQPNYHEEIRKINEERDEKMAEIDKREKELQKKIAQGRKEHERRQKETVDEFQQKMAKKMADLEEPLKKNREEKKNQTK